MTEIRRPKLTEQSVGLHEMMNRQMTGFSGCVLMEVLSNVKGAVDMMIVVVDNIVVVRRYAKTFLFCKFFKPILVCFGNFGSIHLLSDTSYGDKRFFTGTLV